MCDTCQRKKYNAIHFPVLIGSCHLYILRTSERKVCNGALTMINLSICLRRVSMSKGSWSKSSIYCAVKLWEPFNSFCLTSVNWTCLEALGLHMQAIFPN